MGVDTTTQKLNVVYDLGNSSIIGYINPVVGMVTNFGNILTVSGNILVIGTGDQILGNYYVNDVYITSGNAVAGFSFSSGDGSVLLGTGLWPYGSKVVETSPASGVALIAGSTIDYFTL